MTDYPAGAGPAGGYFQGSVWVPAAAVPGASTTGPTPTIGGPGPTAYTRRVEVNTFYSPPVPGPGGIPVSVMGFMPNPGPHTYLLRRITLACPAMTGCRCYVLLTQQTAAQVGVKGLDFNYVTPLSSTARGDFDENEATPPYAIAPGWNVAFLWDRLNGSVIITGVGQNIVHVEYDEA